MMRYIVRWFEYISSGPTVFLAHYCYSLGFLVTPELRHQGTYDIRRNAAHTKEVFGIAEL